MTTYKLKKCPKGNICCKRFEHISEEIVQREALPSGFRCRAFHTLYYIHNFERCPFPSQQEINEKD